MNKTYFIQVKEAKHFGKVVRHYGPYQEFLKALDAACLLKQQDTTHKYTVERMTVLDEYLWRSGYGR